jgi:alpha-tubulin suppressor-like RCC1 family protein
VQALALGGVHSCALLPGGEVRCWGSNSYGQLGNGATTGVVEGVTSPVPVLSSPGGPPLTGVQEVALGSYHSCAQFSGGEVRCWGKNEYGQLGDGTTINRLTPVPVLQWAGGPPLTDVHSLSLGYKHSCAVLNGGEARCWGSNDSGLLGDGTTRRRLTPVPVLQWYDGPPLSGVQALASSGHTCAWLGGSDVRCWGNNYYGQLGDGTTTDQLTPVPVRQAPGDPP